MRTIEETGKLMFAIQAFDNRSLTKEVIKLWHDALQPYSFADCERAVKEHFTSSEKWLLPIDIIKRVKSIRNMRAQRIGDLRLHEGDELDDNGDILPGAGERYKLLANLVMDGAITEPQYRAYQRGEMSLTELSHQAKAITA